MNVADYLAQLDMYPTLEGSNSYLSRCNTLSVKIFDTGPYLEGYQYFWYMKDSEVYRTEPLPLAQFDTLFQNFVAELITRAYHPALIYHRKRMLALLIDP